MKYEINVSIIMKLLYFKESATNLVMREGLEDANEDEQVTEAKTVVNDIYFSNFQKTIFFTFCIKIQLICLTANCFDE